MSLSTWWAARKARKDQERAQAAAKEQARWKCVTCGKPDRNEIDPDWWAIGSAQSKDDPSRCEDCHRVRAFVKEEVRRERAKRIADLAALVMKGQRQYTPRGGLDPVLTVESAWLLAEALYEKERRS